MNKVKLILDVAQLMLKVVQDLRSLSDSVQAVCDAVTEGLSEEQQTKAIKEKPAVEEKPPFPWSRSEVFWLKKARQTHLLKTSASKKLTLRNN